MAHYWDHVHQGHPPESAATQRPWTRLETVQHQYNAIRLIDPSFSECVTTAIIDLIQKHYVSDRISTNGLYRHAMRDVTSPEAEIHIPEVIAMRCMNGGRDPPGWSERCRDRGLGEYVEREVELLRRGLCICERRSSGIRLGGCKNSVHDCERARSGAWKQHAN